MLFPFASLSLCRSLCLRNPQQICSFDKRPSSPSPCASFLSSEVAKFRLASAVLSLPLKYCPHFPCYMRKSQLFIIMELQALHNACQIQLGRKLVNSFMDTIKTHLLIPGSWEEKIKLGEMEGDQGCRVTSCIWCSPQLVVVCCKSNRTDCKHPLCNAKPALQAQS